MSNNHNVPLGPAHDHTGHTFGGVLSGKLPQGWTANPFGRSKAATERRKELWSRMERTTGQKQHDSHMIDMTQYGPKPETTPPFPYIAAPVGSALLHFMEFLRAAGFKRVRPSHDSLEPERQYSVAQEDGKIILYFDFYAYEFKDNGEFIKVV